MPAHLSQTATGSPRRHAGRAALLAGVSALTLMSAAPQALAKPIGNWVQRHPRPPLQRRSRERRRRRKRRAMPATR